MPVIPSTQATARETGRRSWWSRALSDAERRRTPAPPAWAVFVDEAFGEAPVNVPGGEGTWGPRPDIPSPEAVWLPPLAPLLAAAGARFAVCAAQADPAQAAVVGAGARDWLAGCLVRLAARTFAHELAQARAAGTLRGRDPAERFADFVLGLCAPGATAALLRRYPVLARLLGERALAAVDAAAELASRLAADRGALAAGLLGGGAGPLTAVRLGLGEPHRGGRTVAVLDFGGTPRLVYKPRPLGMHARWNELLAEYGAESPRPVRLLPRGGYGWAEYVPPAPAADRAAVRRFYRRLGAQLALLYAVDATDIHGQNVLAHGDQPVVVDVETLFHPCRPPGTDGGGDPVLAALADSVLRTSVLPAALFGGYGFLDVSAVGALPGEAVAAGLPRWADPGTDTMRLVYDRAARFDGTNRPLSRGVPADPAAHAADLRRGFRACYRGLTARAAELGRDGGPLDRFAAERLRFVPRPTQTYADLLDEATAPQALRDHTALLASFDALHSPTGHPEQAHLVPAEAACLATGDVPVFEAAVGGRSVLTPDGGALPGLLPRPGLAAVRAKLPRLGGADLARQEWLIAAALATKSPARQGRSPGLAALVAPRGVRGAVAAATWLGDELLRRASRDGVRVNWAGLGRPDGTHWSVLPLGADLGDGYPGVALFLAELARATGLARYQEAAALAVAPLPALTRALAAAPDVAAAVGPGLRGGLGGIAYAAVRLASLLDSADLAAAGCAALAAFATACRAGDAAALPAARALHAATGLPEVAALADELRSRDPGAAGDTGNRGDPGGDRRNRTGGGAAGDAVCGCPRPRHPSAARDHSLCHGAVHGLERLAALRDAGDRRAGTALGVAGARLLDEIRRGGVRCGAPGGVPVPGLLTGLAGVGHGLLRLARGPGTPPALPPHAAGPAHMPVPTSPKEQNPWKQRRTPPPPSPPRTRSGRPRP
ncbi:type 2 lanthipeptide synthetase LanM family protein [Streptomyces sp. NPDC050560]|uniref:type 2 lanthipeptide synthetase LanM family protein n=1 Tax=Streptomyces sp. NPDC050560 TaxID=3365630 RepID=UPI00379BB986